MASALDVPTGKSETLGIASAEGIRACENAFTAPKDSQIVFRALASGSLFPSRAVAIATTNDGHYLVLHSAVLKAADASQTGTQNNGRDPELTEVPLALRLLAVFHSELERPRVNKLHGLFFDVDTMVWVESRPGHPVLSGERVDCVDRDTRLGRMFELVGVLCAYRDCYPDERVKALSRIDKIVTEIEVSLKFESLMLK